MTRVGRRNQSTKDQGRDAGEWLHEALHRFHVLDDYWWSVKIVVGIAFFLVLFIGAAFMLDPEAGISAYLVVFVAFGAVIAVSAGYMLLKGDPDTVEAIKPDFDRYHTPLGDRFPRFLDHLNHDEYDGRGSLILGLVGGAAFLVLASLAAGYPFDWDGWLDLAFGGASLVFRVVALILLLVMALIGTRLHGSRTCVGFSIPLVCAILAYKLWWFLR